ncbi:MAG: c-type cytochrome [Candidatus Sulfotelmatobacter sp.]
MNRHHEASAPRQPLGNHYQPSRVQIQRNAIHHKITLGLVLVLAGLSNPGLAQSAPPAGKPAGQKDSSVARGEYIVNSIAVCSQCHTPRDSKGRPEQAHWLEGAAVWLKSAEPVEDWPLQAPRIAGALPGTDEEMVKLLTTGIWKTGTYLRPPMPQFRMKTDDAEAVVAYLKSVTPVPK